MLEIYTDGSAHPNPGPGGFGVIVLDKDKNFCDNNYQLVEVYSKQFDNTTNNEMELKAILYAFLIAYQNPKENYIIYSDSSYAINVFTQWAANWAKNGWTKSDKKPIQNLNLIREGYKIYTQLNNCAIVKVKGHQGNICNELVDALATDNKKKIKQYLSYFNNGDEEKWKKFT